MTTPQQMICSVISVLLLAGCALVARRPAQPVRKVNVRIVADPAFRRANQEWRATASDLLEATSDYWEEEFQIRLVPTAIEPWPLEETTSSAVTLMELLEKAYPRNGSNPQVDIVIGLTHQQVNFYNGGRARADRIGDCSKGLGNYIVSYVREPFAYDGKQINHDVLALVHEMGHVFGAMHTSDPKSIMNADFGFRTDFDTENRTIVMKNRLCPFASGRPETGDRGPGTGVPGSLRSLLTHGLTRHQE